MLRRLNCLEIWSLGVHCDACDFALKPHDRRATSGVVVLCIHPVTLHKTRSVTGATRAYFSKSRLTKNNLEAGVQSFKSLVAFLQGHQPHLFRHKLDFMKLLLAQFRPLRCTLPNQPVEAQFLQMGENGEPPKRLRECP